MITMQKMLLCSLIVELSSCATRSVPEVPNPMPAIWKSVRDEIDSMEKAHARESTWRDNCEPSSIVTIKTASALLDACPAGFPSKGLQADFARSTKVVQYDFECDYHTLVFFDAGGRAWKVIKW
jgi:hypothetical protein